MGLVSLFHPLDLLYSDTENTKHSVVALLDRLQTYWYQVKRIMCQNPIFNRWKKQKKTTPPKNKQTKKKQQKKQKNKYKHTEKQTNKQQQQKLITKSDFQFVHLREKVLPVLSLSLSLANRQIGKQIQFLQCLFSLKEKENTGNKVRFSIIVSAKTLCQISPPSLSLLHTHTHTHTHAYAQA